MSRAFVSEGASMPQVFLSKDSAESSASLQRVLDGGEFQYEVRARERGGWLVARLRKSGEFDGWVEE